MSENVGRQADSVRLPDTILAAYMQGNTLLPQTDIGLDILVGSALLGVYLDPNVNGAALFASGFRVDGDQVAHAMRGMRALHRQHNVACQVEGGPYEDRVGGLIRASVASARTNSIASLALALMNDKAAGQGLGTETVGHLLFSRDERGQLLRPEGPALQGLWAAAKRAMLSKEGRSAMKHYQKAAVTVMDRTSPDFTAARSEVRYALNQLVGAELEKSVPQIQTATGVRVGRNAIDSFMYINSLSA